MPITIPRLLVALVLTLAGAWLAWNTVPVLANGGFLLSERERFETPTHALVFADAEDRAFAADTWSEGDTSNGFRVDARSAGSGRLFVGVARVDQVLGLPAAREGSISPGGEFAPCPNPVPRGYLEGVSYQLIGSLRTRVRGARRPARPDEQGIWENTAIGSSATADWGTHGDVRGSEPCRVLYWYPVVMNADGSAGVAAGVRFGARERPLAAIVSGIGVALVITAALVAWQGIRRERARH